MYLPRNCTIMKGHITEYPENCFWDYLFIRNGRDVYDWTASFNHLRGLIRRGG